MKKFFIFLDIDGVMYDWDFIKNEVDGGNLAARGLKQFKPESIEALNLLMDTLRQTHKVQLVISSTWRDHAIVPLYKNGAHLKGAVDSTPVSGKPEYRALEIISYLEKRNLNENDYDFVVIDDEYFDFKKYFTDDKIIKTEMFHNALSVKQVQEFLIRKNLLAPEANAQEKE
jgi:hypothetical protein